MDPPARSSLALLVLLGLHTVDHAVNQPSHDVPALGGVIGLLGFAIVAGLRRLGAKPATIA